MATAVDHAVPGRPRRRWWVAALAIPVAFVVLTIAAWAIDTATSGGEVARNTAVADHAVGGKERSDLLAVVEQVARSYRDTPVRIITPTGTYTTTADAVGLRVDQNATVQAVMDVGRDELLPLRPLEWLRSIGAERQAPIRHDVTIAHLREALTKLQGAAATPAVEPSIALAADGRIAVVPGQPGHGLDPAVVDHLLVEAADAAENGQAVVISTAPVDRPPHITDADAGKLADHANTITAGALTVATNDTTAQVPVPALRSWIRAKQEGDALSLVLDADAVRAGLAQVLPPKVPPKDASFTIVDGKPVLQPSQDGTGCCSADAPDRVLAALERGAGEVDVPAEVQHPSLTTEQAQALGIVEEVGQPTAFGPTTHHAAGEPRVTNIHRIADIVRGAVIQPGQTFSVNSYVGERTAAKGFVDAPVIYSGTFSHDIGGGVSQFATTLFNAALYAGLEFGEYQSHSIAISRYPKGHDATISWPHPDLVIKNTTPYGILIWPTYTDSSVTVHLYSTHYVDVQVGEPTSKAGPGVCTRWTTPRTRTFLDGKVDHDSVSATYRPAEGVNCS
jgi:vancomycin resistance protein YoaR